MSKKMILFLIIAFAIISFLVGCGSSASAPQTSSHIAATPSPSANPSPVATPAFSASDAERLKEKYHRLAAMTRKAIEKKGLLKGTDISEMVCDSWSNFREAEEIEYLLTTKDKGPAASKVISPEAAKQLAEAHLGIFAQYAIAAGKAQELDLSCWEREGRFGTISEVLNDMAVTFDSRGLPIERSGMSLNALRALALARTKEMIPSVYALAKARKKNAQPEDLRALVEKATLEWSGVEESNLWGFTPQELGLTHEQVKFESGG